MTLKVGALFAGMGGLELGLARILDVEPAWFSEVDAAPSTILAHHWPDVPNHGDITKVRWADVEPVDIITGGSPCQDLSHAGKRAGMKAGTRSGLWASMCDAIDTIRPSLVLWENVRGALSAEADSGVEPCPICVGAPGEQVTLRALGRVLGDLAELGYDAAWTGLRAADVGAPHGRFRVFVLAWPATDADNQGREGAQPAAGHVLPDRGAVADARRVRWNTRRPAGPSQTEGRRPLGHIAGCDSAPVTLLPTPRATDGTKGGPNQRGSSGDLMLPSAVTTLLPPPAVNDMGAGKTVDAWDDWTARMKAAHGNGNGHGASLSIEALRMLPTPTAADHKASGGDPDTANVTLTDATVRGRTPWGDYAPAIARWERALGRTAPAPTEPTGKGGAHRLSPRFVEWMMGLPAGWVDVPGVGRNAQLKALGNGVVPQQAAAAIEHLLDVRAGVTGEAAA